MSALSDAALAHLRELVERPEPTGDASGDAGDDAGGDASPNDNGQDGAAPEPDPTAEKQPATPNRQQDERILDQLEEAPTYQEQEAKNRASTRRGRAMEDK